MITSGFQRGLMKAVGASAGTLRRLSAFISRRVCTAASTPCAAGPCCSPNFSLGEEYEHAPPATNRQISPYLPSGRFRTGLPVEGLAIERGDLFYACPRASVFLLHGARRRPSDARRKHACHGRDKHHRRCSFKRRPGLVMRTTTCVWSRTAATTRIGMPTKLCCVPGSADVYRSCNFRASHDRGHSRRWIGARQGQSKSGGAVIAAPATLKKPIAVAEVL